MDARRYPWGLVTERELGYLSNDILERYPEDDLITQRMLLILRIQEFDKERELQAIEEQAPRDYDGDESWVGYPDPDLEGPNHPCNYCYVLRCAECKGFQFCEDFNNALQEGKHPRDVFRDMTEAEYQQAMRERGHGRT
jgi:hypothetical protein